MPALADNFRALIESSLERLANVTGIVRQIPLRDAVIVGFVSLVCTFAAFVLVAKLEGSRILEKYHQEQAVPLTALLEEHLSHHLETVERAANFFSATGSITRSEFDSFTGYSLAHNGALELLEWIPRISGAEREVFESADQPDGLDDFRIWELGPDGERMSATPRSEYYPIYFIQPLELHAASLGFDIGSDPRRRAAFDLARDTASTVVSQRVPLMQASGVLGSGIFVYHPVYTTAETPDLLEERSEQLVGFIGGVFHIETLVNEALAGVPNFKNLDFHLMDLSAPLGNRILIHHRIVEGYEGRDNAAADAGSARQSALELYGENHFATEIVKAGRHWRLMFYPTAGISSFASPYSLIAALGVLLLSASIASTIVIVRGRAEMLSHLVSERTHDLEASNISLRAAQDERIQAQENLRKQNSDLELLQRVTEAVNASTNWDEAIRTCLTEVCEHLDWPVGHAIQLTDEKNNILASTGIWYLKDEEKYRPVVQVSSDNQIYNSGPSFVRNVLLSGQARWIADIHSDPSFKRADAKIRTLPVSSCFAFPVTAGSTTVAVMEFFSEGIQEPDQAILDLVSQIGTQLGRAAERNIAESRLRDNEEFMRLITDNIPIGLNYVDADGRLQFVNKVMENWFALPREQTTGMKLAEVLNTMGDSDISELKQNVDKVHEGEARNFEMHHTYPDGIFRHVMIDKVPHFDPDGDVIGNFTVVQDVTNRKQIEAQLNQAQKMDAIGQLTGGIAHDFNNLLMVVDGYTRRALEKRDDWDTVEESLNEVLKGTARAATLTKQLLSFSRRNVMERTTFRPIDAIADTEALLRRTVDERFNLVFKTESGDDCVETDSSEYAQALLNLVNNARDAMNDRGTITVGTRTVELDEAFTQKHENLEPGKYVESYVADQGHGIDEETLAHIFEPFFTTKEQGKGTGLGLAMVYGFAQQSGGTIGVTSTVGEGTTFSIYLPYVDAKPEALTAEIGEVMMGQGETVLLVEDDDPLRKLVEGMLQSMNYKVLSAEDGAVALELEEEYEDHIDLLLTDMVMPGMNGQAVAEMIRDSRPDIKVVFMSGYPTRSGQKAMDIPDFGRFLQKPVTPANLAKALRAELSAEASSDESTKTAAA